MNIKQLNKSKVPIVRIDNSLEKFVNLPLFQDKVDKANEILRRVGLSLVVGVYAKRHQPLTIQSKTKKSVLKLMD